MRRQTLLGRAQGIPNAKEQTRGAKSWDHTLESRRDGPPHEPVAHDCRHQRHRKSSRRGKQEKARDGIDSIEDRGYKQNANGSRATRPVDKAYPKRSGRRPPHAIRVLMRMRRRVLRMSGVFVDVWVRMANLAVTMGVRVKVAPSPAEQQSHGQNGRDQPHDEFRCATESVRQLRAEQHDRQAESDKCGGVAESPE